MKKIKVFLMAIYFIIFSMSGSVLAGEIISGDGMALKNGNLNKPRVTVWARNHGADQKWHYDKANARIIGGSGSCLSVNPDCQFTKGCPVQWNLCYQSRNTTWYIVGDKIKSGANLCLDVHAPCRKENGCKVQVWSCTNNAVQQKWTYIP